MSNKRDCLKLNKGYKIHLYLYRSANHNAASNAPTPMIPSRHFLLGAMALAFTSHSQLAQAGNAFASGQNAFAAATEVSPTGGVGDTTNLLAFTKEGGEPTHRPGPSLAADRTAWWKWTAPADGLCSVDTLLGISQNTEFTDRVVDTLIAVYQGANINVLTQIAYNDDSISASNPGQPMGLSRTSFWAVQGTTYHIVVDGARDDSVAVAQQNVRLEVRFVPTEKVSRFGLFRYSDRADLLGSIVVNLTTQHAYSAVANIGGTVKRFSGSLDSYGFATVVIPPRVIDGVKRSAVTLHLDMAEDSAQAMLVADDTFPHGADLSRAIKFTTPNPAPQAGYFTGSATHKLFPAVVPLHSIGSFTVAKNGKVRGTWRMGDGTAVPFASQLVDSDALIRFELYRPLHRKRGGLALGGNLFPEGQIYKVGIYGKYVRPAGISGPFFANGLVTDIYGGDAATYTRPQPNNRALGFLNPTGIGTFAISNYGPELPGEFLLETVTLGTNNKFTFASNTRKPSLTLNPSTGVVSGYVTDDNNVKRRVTAMLFLEGGVTPRLRGFASGITTNLPFEIVQ
jgi:hypothetical protein